MIGQAQTLEEIKKKRSSETDSKEKILLSVSLRVDDISTAATRDCHCQTARQMTGYGIGTTTERKREERKCARVPYGLQGKGSMFLIGMRELFC